jgi:predicted RecA/RadA family phage recombinase
MQTPAIRRENGDSIPYTPASAVNPGDVVLQGALAGIATDPIPASALGAIDVNGIFRVPKDASVFSVGQKVYWNPAGSPTVGTASTGAATSTALGAVLLGVAVAAQVTGDATVDVKLGVVPDDSLPPYQYATGTTTTTFTAGELTGAKFNVYNSTATTPGSIATRTAAQMFGDVPNAAPGMQFVTRIINSSGSANTMTITAGLNVTLSGTTTYTIAEFAYRDFLITFTDATHATMQAIGGGAAATN